MDKIIEQQNGSSEARELAEEKAQELSSVSSISGDKDTGFRTQTELEAELAELQNTIAELQQERTALQQQLQKKAQELEQYQSAVNELAGQVGEMQRLALKAWNKFDQASDALVATQTRLHELETTGQTEAQSAGVSAGGG